MCLHRVHSSKEEISSGGEQDPFNPTFFGCSLGAQFCHHALTKDLSFNKLHRGQCRKVEQFGLDVGLARFTSGLVSCLKMCTNLFFGHLGAAQT